MKHSFSRRHGIALAVVLLGAGCATARDATVPASPEAPTEQPPASTEFDPALAEQVMNRPLDGSSVDAFEAGLAQVRAAVSLADYRRLQIALQWLEFYDIPSRGEAGRLYRSLDGMTPREIISRAQWRGK